MSRIVVFIETTQGRIVHEWDQWPASLILPAGTIWWHTGDWYEATADYDIVKGLGINLRIPEVPADYKAHVLLVGSYT